MGKEVMWDDELDTILEDDSIYSEEVREQLLEDDEISSNELGFMKGYEEADALCNETSA